MLDLVLETSFGILDDAVDEELDAIDDLIMDASAHFDIADNLIPDKVIDNEHVENDSEKYL